jgi:hypothetical protein
VVLPALSSPTITILCSRRQTAGLTKRTFIYKKQTLPSLPKKLQSLENSKPILKYAFTEICCNYDKNFRTLLPYYLLLEESQLTNIRCFSTCNHMLKKIIPNYNFFHGKIIDYTLLLAVFVIKKNK